MEKHVPWNQTYKFVNIGEPLRFKPSVSVTLSKLSTWCCEAQVVTFFTVGLHWKT